MKPGPQYDGHRNVLRKGMVCAAKGERFLLQRIMQDFGCVCWRAHFHVFGTGPSIGLFRALVSDMNEYKVLKSCSVSRAGTLPKIQLLI